MKRVLSGTLAALALLAMFAFACKKEESGTTDTSYSSTSSSTTSTAASDPSGTTSTNIITSPLSAADKDFAMKAAQGGMAEVSLGQMAAQKATDADVKNFGNRMVNDHGKAGDELNQLATNKGIALPTDLDAEAKKTSADLSKKSKDFDKSYMNDMVKDHEKDVKEFEKASKDVQDPDLKSWASKTLPVIQDHLNIAKQIASKLK
jgi:putative membrane protein